MYGSPETEDDTHKKKWVRSVKWVVIGWACKRQNHVPPNGAQGTNARNTKRRNYFAVRNQESIFIRQKKTPFGVVQMTICRWDDLVASCLAREPWHASFGTIWTLTSLQYYYSCSNTMSGSCSLRTLTPGTPGIHTHTTDPQPLPPFRVDCTNLSVVSHRRLRMRRLFGNRKQTITTTHHRCRHHSPPKITIIIFQN